MVQVIYLDDQFKNVKALPHARIPIVKLKDVKTGISCDIGVNNLLAIENTKLLKAYSEIDERVLILGLVIKYWAKKRNLNEPYFGTLSSYCYILMVIFYLQTRPVPILPNLQKMEPAKQKEVSGFNVSFLSDLSLLYKKFPCVQNKESIAELLCGFFKYFAYDFDYKNGVISIREGVVLTKMSKNWTILNSSVKDKYWFCVEDPFEVTHNLARLVDKDSLYDIRGEFIRAYQLMCRDTDLETICTEL